MSFQDNALTVYFIYKNDANDTSDDMKQAATYLNDYIESDRIKWIYEYEATDLIADGELTKKHVFVLEEFEGKVFEDLQETPALIVGPRCLLVCLLDCVPIPLHTSPVYITAMRDLYICCSGFDVTQKNKMKNLISYMGGYYLKELNKDCNYLISNTIKSTKYEHAVINSITVMQAEWIDAVWKAGKTKTILATDSIFDKYKLPIFYGACISASGLSLYQRDQIIKLVEENGGTYHRTFKSSSTDILIITKDGTVSEKYKAAIRYKKDVLLPEWIFDSVKKGFALPFPSYTVKNLKNSTPTKDRQSTISFAPNCTELSGIYGSNQSNTTIHVDESICNVNYSMKKPTRLTEKNYQMILAEISPLHAKKAGTFLDGCCIYLSGFTAEEKDKLNKILNVGGATRYNEINEKITHIIVGELNASEFESWHEQGIQTGAYIIKLDWLMESINIKQPANELKYRAKLPIQRQPEAPSPQSKKTLHSMNNSFKKPELPKKRLNLIEKFNNNTAVTSELNNLVTDENENDFLAHYSQENNMSAANLTFPDLPTTSRSKKLKTNKESTITAPPPIIQSLPLNNNTNCTNEFSMTTEEYKNLNFFDGLTIFIDKNYDQEIYSQTIVDCETARGKVVTATYRDYVDYVIVSSDMPVDINLIPVKSKNIVNAIWLEDAIRCNDLVKIEYYHKPISIMAGKKPLIGLIIVISAYTEYERVFLQSLVTVLGATCKDIYERKEKPILICPSPTTVKYNAALKWNYPAVKSEWLVKCSETGVIEPMESYLVGDTRVSDYFLEFFKSSTVNIMNTPKSSRLKKSSTADETHQQQNYGEPSENIVSYTPLRHKRISELAGPSDRREYTTPDNKTGDGNIAQYSPMFGDIDKLLSDIESVEVREFCKQQLLDMQNTQTPELERLKRLARTPNTKRTPETPESLPGVPEYCTTPAYQKRLLQYVEDRFYLNIKKIKPDTPLAEIKMRLWRDTLPPDFVATCKYFQDDLETEELQKNDSATKKIKTPVTKTTDHSKNITNQIDTNENSSPGVKRLKDFVKNCEEERKSSSSKKILIENTPLEEETQGLPQRFESEMMFNSERMVGWRDPTEFTLSRRNKINTMKHKGVPKFNISALPEFDKLGLCQQIKQLRGELCENLASYDPTCTHIVCEKPNRGEKLLSSVAGGKWILSINYIADSFKEGYYLDEELYEWGNPIAKNLPQLQETEQTIANAFYCWRKKITNEEIGGAFSGQSIILRVPSKILASFTTVITAGGGIVLPATSPYDDLIIEQATHCYVDIRSSPLSKTEHEKLVEAGVHVLNFMFISKYLTIDPDTDMNNYILSL